MGCQTQSGLYGRANRLTRRHFVDAGEHLGLERRRTALGSARLLLRYLDIRRRPKGTDPRQTKVGPEEKIPPLSCGAQHKHRHPREAKPINWAKRGGLASGQECLLTPRPTFHRASRTLSNPGRLMLRRHSFQSGAPSDSCLLNSCAYGACPGNESRLIRWPVGRVDGRGGGPTSLGHPAGLFGRGGGSRSEYVPRIPPVEHPSPEERQPFRGFARRHVDLEPHPPRMPPFLQPRAVGLPGRADRVRSPRPGADPAWCRRVAQACRK